MTLNSLNTGSLREQAILPESYSDYIHANAHVVSWAAILAGAIAAAALSLILLVLGSGLGLSSISPWSHEGISATSFGVSTIIWLAVTQILAAGIGGYLAGRLRTKWVRVHSDEVYFRDTVHGFMAWAVATLATAALLSSAIGTIVTGAAQAGANVVGGAAIAAVAAGTATAGAEMNKTHSARESDGGSMGYFIDSLFRPDFTRTSTSASASTTELAPTDASQNATSAAEVTRIFVNAMNMKVLPPADAFYVGQLIAQRTGLAQQEAEKRVNDIFASIQAKKNEAEITAKNAADKLRKATIYATLWLFVSFLMGAFSASLAATWGGRSRDASSNSYNNTD